MEGRKKIDYVRMVSAWVSVGVGFVLIIVGLFGLFLPIIPGIVLIIAGIIILNRNVNITFLKNLEESLKRKVSEEVEKFRKYRAGKKKQKIKKMELKLSKMERKIRRHRQDESKGRKRQ